MPGFGSHGVSIGLTLFAFTTMLGWAFYGEKCMEYLFGTKVIMAPSRVSRADLSRVFRYIAIHFGLVDGGGYLGPADILEKIEFIFQFLVAFRGKKGLLIGHSFASF